MAFLNDHGSRFRKGLSNPFSSHGLEWCLTCQQQVDHTTQGRQQGTTYAYKRTCDRCGGVIARGVADVTLVDQPLSPAALRWSLTPEADRR